MPVPPAAHSHAMPGTAGVSFAPDEGPCLGGSPFVHPSFCDGMLVTAADLTQLHAAVALKQRVLAAFLGPGTLVGLRVRRGSIDAVARPGVLDRLVVEPGLALDALGRLVWVDGEQCLELDRLLHQELSGGRVVERFPLAEDAREADHPDLEALPPDVTFRRAWVVLRYACCPTQPVAALAGPCGPCDAPRDDACLARVQETFRLDLSPTPPPDPHELQREWLAARAGVATDVAGARAWLAPPAPTHDGADPPTTRPPDRRDRLLDWALGAGAMVPALWAAGVDAPLLLAEVLLVEGRRPDTLEAWRVVNRVRPLAAPPRVVAEELFGQRLAGPDPAEPAPFVVKGWSVAHVAGAGTRLEVALSGAPRAGSVQAGRSVSIERLAPGATAWAVVPQAELRVVPGPAGVEVTAAGPEWDDGTVFQLRLVGDGPGPIVRDGDGAPLQGLADEPARAGRGRDVSIVSTYRGTP